MLSERQIKNIERRAEAVYWPDVSGHPSEELHRVHSKDIPALLAEIRRLQAELQETRDRFYQLQA